MGNSPLPQVSGDWDHAISNHPFRALISLKQMGIVMVQYALDHYFCELHEVKLCIQTVIPAPALCHIRLDMPRQEYRSGSVYRMEELFHNPFHVSPVGRRIVYPDVQRIDEGLNRPAFHLPAVCPYRIRYMVAGPFLFTISSYAALKLYSFLVW